ncbi:MAG: two-component system signal transduction response regulator [Anaerocolumna sp.]|jgi:two-component SAPR family response regulator|nr:two-component system signal transduction response regulator [Anaerocolumna sp.]
MYWISIKEGSAPLKWRTKKVKELFAFLLHHKGHPVHRTLIIEELWPDTFVDKGVTLLHTTVYQLRKMLNEIGYENAIQYGNEQYILDINIDSDIKQFHNLIRLSTPNEEEIKALMTLYVGDYFEQEEYAWVIYDQQKIRKAFLQQIEIFIATLTIESPKDILLETCLTKMLQIDIYNDNYVYQLIQFYGRTGNKLRFMEVYNSYKSKLSEDLGLNVPYKFLKLYNEIVEGEA